MCWLKQGLLQRSGERTGEPWRGGAAKTGPGSGREAGEGTRGGEETLGGLGMGEMGGASKGDGGRSGVPQGEIVRGVGGTGEAETERVRGSRCFALGAQMSRH